MQIVAVRHGRTAWNAVRRFQGQTNVPLDVEGRAQAQALAVHLRAERFDVALVSPLERAWTTAQAISEANGVVLESEPRLSEMHFGAWEGLTWDEIVARAPELAREDGVSPRSYAPPDGETFEELCARIAPVLAEIVHRVPPSGTALVVSHAGPMHALLRVTLGADDPRALGVKLVPAGIIRLERRPAGTWELRTMNETAPPLAESAIDTP